MRTDKEVEVAPEVEFDRRGAKVQKRYAETVGVTGKDIELIEIETDEQMVKLKTQFRLHFPVLMSNILKVLLFNEEERLACLLTAYYEVALEQEMIYQAVCNERFKWLNYVWAFGKNWIGIRRNWNGEKFDRKTTRKSQPRIINLVRLFSIIGDLLGETSDRRMKALHTICNWKLAHNPAQPS